MNLDLDYLLSVASGADQARFDATFDRLTVHAMLDELYRLTRTNILLRDQLATQEEAVRVVEGRYGPNIARGPRADH